MAKVETDKHAHLRTPEVRKKAGIARAKTMRLKKKLAKQNGGRVDVPASVLKEALGNGTRGKYTKRKLPTKIIASLIVAVAEHYAGA